MGHFRAREVGMESYARNGGSARRCCGITHEMVGGDDQEAWLPFRRGMLANNEAEAGDGRRVRGLARHDLHHAIEKQPLLLARSCGGRAGLLCMRREDEADHSYAQGAQQRDAPPHTMVHVPCSDDAG